jgi:3-mercaptopyruvate sulfurtransferase SseA
MEVSHESDQMLWTLLMNNWGYKNVKVLDGGLMRWIKLGYPVETG